MIGSTKRTLALACLIAGGLSACVNTPSGTAIDRLRPTAASHAAALAGEDMASARETGLTLLEQLAALGGW
jgi:hypothetical protein